MLTWVYATAFPSVCLCVTRVLCIKTAKHFVEILSPPNSPIILVFRHRGSLLNFDGFTPNRGAEYRGLENLAIFDQSGGTRYISETVRDTAIVAIEVE